MMNVVNVKHSTFASVLTSCISILYIISSGTIGAFGAPEVTITVGQGPQSIAYDPSNGEIYVANFGTPPPFNSGTPANSVTVINGLTNNVIATIYVGLGPSGVAYNPENGHVYVANSVSNTVSIIDDETNKVMTTVPLPQDTPIGIVPKGFAFDPINGDIYIGTNGPSVYVLDGSTNQLTSKIPLGGCPVAVAFDPANGNVYAANKCQNSVSVINGTTNQVVGNPIPVGREPMGIVFNDNNTDIYVTDRGFDAVSVINGKTNQVVGNPIIVRHCPAGITVNPNTGWIYVTSACSSPGTVSVINGKTNQVVGNPIPVGESPYGITFDNGTGKLFVTNMSPFMPRGTVSVIR
jgi:YVTN family beta-propeller protein